MNDADTTMNYLASEIGGVKHIFAELIELVKETEDQDLFDSLAAVILTTLSSMHGAIESLV